MISIYRTIATYLAGGTDIHQLEQLDDEKAEKNPFNAIILKYMNEFEKEGFEFHINSLPARSKVKTIVAGDPIPQKIENLVIYENHARILISNDKGIHIESLYSFKELIESRKLGISVITAMIMLSNFKKLSREDLKLEITKELKEKLQRKTLFKALTKLQKSKHTYKIDEKTRRINESYERINAIRRDIQGLQKDIKELEQDELFSDFEKDKEKIVNFLFNHSAIDQETIRVIYDYGDYHLIFRTKRLYAYKINKKYLEKSKKELFRNHYFEKIADEIINDNIKIDVGKYEYSIIFRNPIAFTVKGVTDQKNPHFSINCMGTASEPYYNALKNNEIIKAFNIHIEFLQSINFGDPGSHRLFEKTRFLHIPSGKYIKNGDEL